MLKCFEDNRGKYCRDDVPKGIPKGNIDDVGKASGKVNANASARERQKIRSYFRKLLLRDFKACHPQLLPMTREQKLKLKIRLDRHTFTLDLEYQPRKARAAARNNYRPTPLRIKCEKFETKMRSFEAEIRRYRLRVNPLLTRARTHKASTTELLEKFHFNPVLLEPLEEALGQLMDPKKLKGKDYYTCLDMIKFLDWFADHKKRLACKPKDKLPKRLAACIRVMPHYHFKKDRPATDCKMADGILNFNAREKMTRAVLLGGWEFKDCSAFEMLRVETRAQELCGCFIGLFHEFWATVNKEMVRRGLEPLNIRR